MLYTPAYASWVNQVERWFGLITQQAIRRGSFSNAKELTRKIKAFGEMLDNMCHGGKVAMLGIPK